ncbi:MAG: hypothetical protein ACLR8Y_11705 [Alistipes indistinctus]
MEHFRLFVLPFWVGAGFLLVVLLYKYISWFIGLAPAERKMFWRSLPTRATWKSVCEIGSESLLHRKIWRTNPLLGYMHTSFALGWFLLILTGWIETAVYFKDTTYRSTSISFSPITFIRFSSATSIFH